MQANQLSKRQQEQLTELGAKESAEIQDLLEREKLPETYIDTRFQGWLKAALPHETYVTMNAAYPEYKALWLSLHSKTVYEFNLREMGLALNCIESKSMAQLSGALGTVSPEEYLALQDAVIVMVIKWQELVTELKQPITERYKTLSGMVINNKPIIMPTGAKIIT